MDNWIVAIGLLDLLVLVVFSIVALIYCRIVKYIYKKTGKNIHPKDQSGAGFYGNDGGDLAQGSVEVFNSRNLFPVVCILINIWYTIDVENKCYLFDVKEFLDYG